MKILEKLNVICNKEWVFKTMIENSPKRHRRALGKRGFTLVELIMVIALVAVLATLSLSSFTNIKNGAKVGRAKAEIRTLEKAVIASFTDRGQLPLLLTDIGSAANINDPWGHPYQYYNVATGSGGPASQYTDINGDPLNVDFDLYSWGLDGTPGFDLSAPTPNASEDDVVRCNEGRGVELGKERSGT